jgi:protein phosphatase
MDFDSTQQIKVNVFLDNTPVDNRSFGNYFEWISSSLTHVGCVRKLNEDACLELTDRQLWVVADGMGGHRAGDVASRTIIDYSRNVPYDQTFSVFVENVENQLVAAHQALNALGRKLGQIAGSTVVALLGHGRHGLVMWAGDSRAYLFRQGGLRRVSRDHSFVEELLAVGGISPEEALSHPRANVITRAVGYGNDLYLDMDMFELFHGDIILLCSDGLYKELEENTICSIIHRHYSPAMIARDLVNVCIERGARDNVTVVVVKVIERMSDTHDKTILIEKGR